MSVCEIIYVTGALDGRDGFFVTNEHDILLLLYYEVR